VANLRDIKRRIVSVRKTQQITRAMRMVAAAKLRRAQEAIQNARPYADRMTATLRQVAQSVGAEHPLLAGRESVRKLAVVVITADRGLCGAFNTNVLRHADALMKERERDLEALQITCVGRKAVEYYQRRRPDQIHRSFVGIGNVTYGDALDAAKDVMGRYEDRSVDEVVLVYGEFVSTMTQRPVDRKLIPIAPEVEEGDDDTLPYDIEPDAESLLATLVPRAIEFAVYRGLLDSQASEHAARMTAMESATRNSEEMIDSLTLQFNRARQAAITKELVEIVSGAEAL
jgi:F-type H+-transporting ATPase subunit gamma